METALNLASVTCLKPFLRPFQESGLLVNTTQHGPVKYDIGGTSRSRSETYLMLGTIGSTLKNKDGSIVRTSTKGETDDIALKRACHLESENGRRIFEE